VPFIHDGAINENVFRADAEQMLIPSPAHGKVVVMDDLPATRPPASAAPSNRLSS
jgi:hypothetical protein